MEIGDLRSSEGMLSGFGLVFLFIKLGNPILRLLFVLPCCSMASK